MLREYDFESRKHPTFTEDDIMNLFPIVKHTNPKVSRLQHGFLSGDMLSCCLDPLLCVIYKMIQSELSDNKHIHCRHMMHRPYLRLHKVVFKEVRYIVIFSQSVSQSVIQSVSESVSQPVSQSLSHSVSVGESVRL